MAGLVLATSKADSNLELPWAYSWVIHLLTGYADRLACNVSTAHGVVMKKTQLKNIIQFHTYDSKPPQPKYFYPLLPPSPSSRGPQGLWWRQRVRGKAAALLHSQLLLLELCLLYYYQCSVVNSEHTANLVCYRLTNKKWQNVHCSAVKTCQSFQHFRLLLMEGVSCKMWQLPTLPLPFQSSPLLSLKKCL